MSYLQTVKTYVDKFYLVNKQKRGVGADLRPRGVWSPGLEIVKNWVLSLSEKFFGWGGDIAKEEAERFAEMVRQAVYSQRYKWVPLSQKYLEWKRRTGRDSRILVATREYVESIRIVRNEVGSWHESEKVVFYEVGLPDIIHLESGLPIRKLAAIHEFGVPSRRIPARPLWRPVWEEFKGTSKEKIIKHMKMRVFDDATKLREDLKAALPGVQVSLNLTGN